MLQIWFADPKFSKYATRDFAIWTESYGGHYGPTIASYFLDQNAAIAAGTITGVKINLKVLSVGNGLTDPYSQYPGYVKYAMSNPYQPLVSASTITSANNSLYQTGGCLSQVLTLIRPTYPRLNPYLTRLQTAQVPTPTLPVALLKITAIPVC
jgi:carboxypeptidase C (cathepsin A)